MVTRGIFTRVSLRQARPQSSCQEVRPSRYRGLSESHVDTLSQGNRMKRGLSDAAKSERASGGRSGEDYRQLGGGLFPKTCLRFVHRSNSPGERSRAPILLDLVDNLTHSSYIAHSCSDAAGRRDWRSFDAFPASPSADIGSFELNSGASLIVLKPSLLES